MLGIAASPTLRQYMQTFDAPYPEAITAGEQFVLMMDGLTAVVWLPSMVLAGVLAMVWTWRVRVNADELSPFYPVLPRAWAWAGWITPIVSLWFPYSILRDVDKADKAALDPAHALPARAPVAWWWRFYLAYWLLWQATTYLQMYEYQQALVLLSSAAAGVVAVLLFRRVVHTVQHDQKTIDSTLTMELQAA